MGEASASPVIAEVQERRKQSPSGARETVCTERSGGRWLTASGADDPNPAVSCGGSSRRAAGGSDTAGIVGSDDTLFIHLRSRADISVLVPIFEIPQHTLDVCDVGFH